MEKKEKTRHNSSEPLPLLLLLRNYFKMSGILLGIWFAGYMNFSTTWILLGIFFYMVHQEYNRTNRLRLEYAKQAMKDERSAITNRLEELPSWVCRTK